MPPKLTRSFTISQKRWLRDRLKRWCKQAEDRFMSFVACAWGKWVEFTNKKKEIENQQVKLQLESEAILNVVEILKRSPPTWRSDDEIQSLIKSFQVLNFPPAQNLEGPAFETFCRKVRIRDFQEQESIYNHGDADCALYTVLSGQVLVSNQPKRLLGSRQQGSSKFNKVYQYGEVFGDQKSLSDRRSESAWSLEPSTLLVVSCRLFKSTCASQHQLTTNFLRNTKWCKLWPEEDIAAFANNLVKENFPAQSRIKEKGEPLTFVFLIEKGTVSLVDEIEFKNKLVSVRLFCASAGMIVGDLEVFQFSSHYKYHIFADTDVFLYKFSPESYQRCLLSKKSLLSDIQDSINGRIFLFSKKIENKKKSYATHRRSTELEEKLDLILNRGKSSKNSLFRWKPILLPPICSNQLVSKQISTDFAPVHSAYTVQEIS